MEDLDRDDAVALWRVADADHVRALAGLDGDKQRSAQRHRVSGTVGSSTGSERNSRARPRTSCCRRRWRPSCWLAPVSCRRRQRHSRETWTLQRIASATVQSSARSSCGTRSPRAAARAVSSHGHTQTHTRRCGNGGATASVVAIMPPSHGMGRAQSTHGELAVARLLLLGGQSQV